MSWKSADSRAGVGSEGQRAEGHEGRDRAVICYAKLRAMGAGLWELGYGQRAMSYGMREEGDESLLGSGLARDFWGLQAWDLADGSWESEG